MQEDVASKHAVRQQTPSSTRIKDASIAIRHSRGYTSSILQRPEMDFREWTRCVDTQQKQKTISKRNFFLIEKCFEDARQDEKHVPDLLESIMRPTDPVKEELRPILSQMTQISSEITKITVYTFQMSGKIPDSTNVGFDAPSSPPFYNIWPR